MLGMSAEFETNLRREHQLEGIKAAKAKGIYKDRKPSIDATAAPVARYGCAGYAVRPQFHRKSLCNTDQTPFRGGAGDPVWITEPPASEGLMMIEA